MRKAINPGLDGVYAAAADPARALESLAELRMEPLGLVPEPLVPRLVSLAADIEYVVGNVREFLPQPEHLVLERIDIFFDPSVIFHGFLPVIIKYGTRAYGCQGIFNERWELWDIGIKGLIEKTSLPRLHTALPRNDNSSSVIARLQRLRASEQSDAFRGMQSRTCVEERIDKCVV